MMDLLVQVTTAHRLQPSAHIIQALGYAPNQGQSDVILPYKPNTPIGTLDTKHIKIIPKSPTKYLNNKHSSSVLSSAGISQRDSLQRGISWNDQLPFENTFRLQVHLPRNQLFVARVSQYVMLESIMKKVCTEKNLDEKKYEFRHPGKFLLCKSKVQLPDGCLRENLFKAFKYNSDPFMEFENVFILEINLLLSFNTINTRSGTSRHCV